MKTEKHLVQLRKGDGSWFDINVEDGTDEEVRNRVDELRGCFPKDEYRILNCFVDQKKEQE